MSPKPSRELASGNSKPLAAYNSGVVCTIGLPAAFGQVLHGVVALAVVNQLGPVQVQPEPTASVR